MGSPPTITADIRSPSAAYNVGSGPRAGFLSCSSYSSYLLPTLFLSSYLLLLLLLLRTGKNPKIWRPTTCPGSIFAVPSGSGPGAGTVPAPNGPGRVRVLSRRHRGPPERPIMRVGCKNACVKFPFKYKHIVIPNRTCTITFSVQY